MVQWREAMQRLRNANPGYTYEPLAPWSREIRLLEVLPRENQHVAEVRVIVRTVSLDDPARPQYEAISYCWGDPLDPNPIFCTDNSIPWVTDSLYAALCNLRLQNRSRLVWADAVCINQSDNIEKSM